MFAYDQSGHGEPPRARVYQFYVLLFIWQERCNPVTAFEALSSQITKQYT